MEFKAKAHKLERAGDGQFGTNWSYVCGAHPIEESVKDGFFDEIRDNLVVGDTIRVIEIQKEVVTGVIDFMVVAKAKTTVNCRPMSEGIIRFKAIEARKDKVAPPVYVEPEKFIEGSGTVAWNPGMKRYVVSVGDKKIVSVKDKEEAEAIARGDKPLPV